MKKSVTKMIYVAFAILISVSFNANAINSGTVSPDSDGTIEIPIGTFPPDTTLPILPTDPIPPLMTVDGSYSYRSHDGSFRFDLVISNRIIPVSQQKIGGLNTIDRMNLEVLVLADCNATGLGRATYKYANETSVTGSIAFGFFDVQSNKMATNNIVGSFECAKTLRAVKLLNRAVSFKASRSSLTLVLENGVKRTLLRKQLMVPMSK